MKWFKVYATPPSTPPQDKKTEIYKRIVSEAAEARPGVLALMDAAIEADGIAVGICSASTRAGFEKVVDSIVGQERLRKLDVIIAGDGEWVGGCVDALVVG